MMPRVWMVEYYNDAPAKLSQPNCHKALGWNTGQIHFLFASFRGLKVFFFNLKETAVEFTDWILNWRKTALKYTAICNRSFSDPVLIFFLVEWAINFEVKEI